MHNQRVEYGKTLVELGMEAPDVVVLEADLGKSTMTCLFEERFPDRYFEMGIAEQNMTGYAAGLALAGKVPFTNSFAVFAVGRAYDQIRQSIGTAGLHVVVVGSSAGLSDFGDGATHQSIDDLGLMSAVPGMTVLTPCDGVEAALATRYAAAAEGPVYLRLCRNDLEDIYPADIGYHPGRPVVLREGGDAVVFTCGIMAHEALEAAAVLEAEGVDLQVVHLPALKPLEEEPIRKLAQNKRAALICEEHSLHGGLTSALSYALRGMELTVEAAAIMDLFGQSAGSHRELLQHYRLDGPSLADRLRGMLGL